MIGLPVDTLPFEKLFYISVFPVYNIRASKTNEVRQMNIYIDESGSINNHNSSMPYFVIALVHVIDRKKLGKVYKRFVSSNYDRLLELDGDKINPKNGRVRKRGGKMFADGAFKELKGAQFDREMKLKFIDYFSRNPYFEVYYIKLNNRKLTDRFCENTTRAFHYTIRMAISYFIEHGWQAEEDFDLQLDERNERAEAKCFLENYLNTELALGGVTTGKFQVAYFDSANNKFIQIADVFSNLFYSELLTGNYTEAFHKLWEQGILKAIFEFPVG